MAYISGYKGVYDGDQVKSKLQRLKLRQPLFIDLMSQTGMAWDPDNKMVIANDKHWANALRVRICPLSSSSLTSVAI